VFGLLKVGVREQEEDLLQLDATGDERHGHMRAVSHLALAEVVGEVLHRICLHDGHIPVLPRVLRAQGKNPVSHIIAHFDADFHSHAHHVRIETTKFDWPSIQSFLDEHVHCIRLSPTRTQQAAIATSNVGKLHTPLRMLRQHWIETCPIHMLRSRRPASHRESAVILIHTNHSNSLDVMHHHMYHHRVIIIESNHHHRIIQSSNHHHHRIIQSSSNHPITIIIESSSSNHHHHRIIESSSNRIESSSNRIESPSSHHPIIIIESSNHHHHPIIIIQSPSSSNHHRIIIESSSNHVPHRQ
jgi:hypothetical protein